MLGGNELDNQQLSKFHFHVITGFLPSQIHRIDETERGGCGLGGGGGGKCQLSVKDLAICQLSVNWLLIIN